MSDHKAAGFPNCPIMIYLATQYNWGSELGRDAKRRDCGRFISISALRKKEKKKSQRRLVVCNWGKKKNQRLDGCLRLCAHFISPFLCISHQTPTMHHFHKQSKRLLASALLFVKIVYWQCSRCPSTASTAN